METFTIILALLGLLIWVIGAVGVIKPSIIGRESRIGILISNGLVGAALMVVAAVFSPTPADGGGDISKTPVGGEKSQAAGDSVGNGLPTDRLITLQIGAPVCHTREDLIRYVEYLGADDKPGELAMMEAGCFLNASGALLSAVEMEPPYAKITRAFGGPVWTEASDIDIEYIKKPQ